MPTTDIVHHALKSGIHAFDTSPYYGPAEELLGAALNTSFVIDNYPRQSYFLLTKVGRIAASSFDYSAKWVKHSVNRSLQRLHTDYLDVVYCHDVEFVSPDEVLVAVKELRRIRDQEGTIKYVGISGYPLDVLCDLADRIKHETGEPIDLVMSYAHYTVQNTRLLTEALPRLKEARVDVVPNASILSIGLLRRAGVPIGAMGDFHPAPKGLREAVAAANDWLLKQDADEKLEVVALRFALQSWFEKGEPLGSRGPTLSGASTSNVRRGVNVLAVSNIDELNDAIHSWHSVLAAVEDGQIGDQTITEGKEALRTRSNQIQKYADGIRTNLQEPRANNEAGWYNYSWQSPGSDFVNCISDSHRQLLDEL